MSVKRPRNLDSCEFSYGSASGEIDSGLRPSPIGQRRFAPLSVGRRSRPRCELPTARFVGVYVTNRFLLNQYVRWPALFHLAVKRRQEPRITASALRFGRRCLDTEVQAGCIEPLIASALDCRQISNSHATGLRHTRATAVWRMHRKLGNRTA